MRPRSVAHRLVSRPVFSQLAFLAPFRCPRFAALRFARYAFMRWLRVRRAAALIGRHRRETFGALALSRNRPEGTRLTIDPIPPGLELAKRGLENRRDVYRA